MCGKTAVPPLLIENCNMALTKEQRSAINRKNAQKSTGPRSPRGKMRSRENARSHGMCAKVVALPEEDPAAIQARHDAWNDYYKPRSPAEQHLVNECIQHTLLPDRVH